MINQSGNKVNSGDLVTLLETFKSHMMREINVSEVGKVEKIENNKYYCKLINNNEITIICTKAKSVKVEKDDIVLIIFADTDFRNNLNKISNDQLTQNINSSILHAKNYGIIISSFSQESGGGEGTTVIANPTLSGSEDELTGLQIGNTKYKIDGGLIIVDDDLDPDSTNPVQNKVISTELDLIRQDNLRQDDEISQLQSSIPVELSQLNNDVGYVTVNDIPKAEYTDLLSDLTGVKGIEWQNLQAGKFSWTSTYNADREAPVLKEATSSWWNSKSGSPLDINFHFTKSEKPASVKYKLGSYAGTNYIQVFCVVNNELVPITESILTTQNSLIEIDLSHNTIKSEQWTIRFTCSGWIDLRLATFDGEFIDGLYTSQFHKEILNKMDKYQLKGSYATTTQLITVSNKVEGLPVQHIININTSANNGTYRCQCHIMAPSTTTFTTTGSIAAYLYAKKPNMRVVATGTYTKDGTVYQVESFEAISNSMVRVEMYKVYDGTPYSVETGAIGVEDIIL